MGNIKFDLDKCCGCGRDFDSNLSKSQHHVFPLFLKPAFEVTIPLCKDCHRKLNDAYIHYENLRAEFKNGTIHSGEFGEGLWSNLVQYLEIVQR